MENAEAHELARERGASKVATRTARGFAIPYMKLLYALSIEGAERIPDEGPVIVAPNHKSFWDAFFVAAATKRPIRFMGKSELFEGRGGRMLVRLGIIFQGVAGGCSSGWEHSRSGGEPQTPRHWRRRGGSSSTAACSRCSRRERGCATH